MIGNNINNINDLRTRTTTSTNIPYVGDINPWNNSSITRGEEDLNYIKVDDVYSRSTLIAKIDELEKRIDKLTKLLESIVD